MFTVTIDIPGALSTPYSNDDLTRVWEVASAAYDRALRRSDDAIIQIIEDGEILDTWTIEAGVEIKEAK